MNKRRTILSVYFLVMLFFVVLPFTAGAQSYSSLQEKDGLLCQQIQDKIKINQEIRKVVKTSIQLGYGACGVIKCAIRGGGDLKQIIEGAVEAGTTKDVVSRCALDAGADARLISVLLVAQLRQCNIEEPGMGYSQPEEPNIIIPVTPVPDRFISPSHF